MIIQYYSPFFKGGRGDLRWEQNLNPPQSLFTKGGFTLTLYKFLSTGLSDMLEKVAFLGRCWMLDTGCSILRNVLRVKSRNIQYPVEDPDVLFGETRIQDQPILAVLFIATTKFE